MSTATSSYSNDVECVLISDEEDVEVPTKLSQPSKSNIRQSTDNKISIETAADRLLNANLDDSDGRRVSRRRKPKAEIGDTVKIGETTKAGGVGSGNHIGEQINDGSKTNVNSQIATSIPYTDKKFSNNENRAETRSRKRERSPSPQNVDAKEIDPIPYKEILSGLEGAAFQSR